MTDSREILMEWTFKSQDPDILGWLEKQAERNGMPKTAATARRQKERLENG